MIDRQAMQLGQWQCPRAAAALQVDDRIQRNESNAHVRRVRRDAHCRRTEDGLVAIEPLYGVAAGTRCTLIAARTVSVVKIAATRSLQEISTYGRHVPNLRRCPREDRARQHGITCPDRTMLRERSVAHRSADQNTTAIRLFNRGRQSAHIDERIRPRDRLAHEIDQIRAAAQISRRTARSEPQRIGGIDGAHIAEGSHAAVSAAMVSLIASIIPLYAPQRHKLPLIRSCSSSRVRITSAPRSLLT